MPFIKKSDLNRLRDTNKGLRDQITFLVHDGKKNNKTIFKLNSNIKQLARAFRKCQKQRDDVIAKLLVANPSAIAPKAIKIPKDVRNSISQFIS